MAYSRPAPRFSGTALKVIACISMLLDHIGAACLERGAALAGRWVAVRAWDILLRCVGRLAFPIYCFLLVEGFAHTRSAKNYALRLLAFAFISELPFDLAFYGSAAYWQHQNVYWTLFFGVAAMEALKAYEGKGALGPALALGCALAAEFMRTDYGALGVLLIVALYALRENRAAQCVVGALIITLGQALPIALGAAAAFVGVWFYSGERGRCPRAAKWAFYIFYPAHLCVLAWVTYLIIT